MAHIEVPHVERRGSIQDPYIVPPYIDDPLIRLDWDRRVNAAGNPLWKNSGRLGSAGDFVGPGGAANPTKLGDLPGYRFSSHRLAAGQIGAIEKTDAMTVEVWFSASALSSYRFLVSYVLTAAPNEGFSMYWTGGNLHFSINSFLNRASIAFTDTTDRFYHAVGTYDRKNIRLYLNTEQGAPQADIAAISYPGGQDLNLGVLAYAGPSYAYPWSGCLGQLKIYPGRAIHRDEVIVKFQQERHIYGV